MRAKIITIMNKFTFYFLSLFAVVSIFSCVKTDEPEVVPPREFAVQYASDKDSIENYLKKNYLTAVNVNGFPDIEVTKIPVNGTQTPIWSNTTYPLQSVTVTNDSRLSFFVNGKSTDVVAYKLYYLVINQGGGKSPIVTDSTFTSYKGWTLDNKIFDSNNSPIWSTYPALSQAEVSLISGYRQIVPKIKTAQSTTVGPDGTISYNNPGIVVVFIPSALGYYNLARTGIPSYSCIVFRIRLHTLRQRDHDGDKILSFNEDLNTDGDFFNDDTDADNIPNFLDIDDDGDLFFTKAEIRKAGTGIQGLATFYPFDPIADDPSTTVNESEPKGIPAKDVGNTSDGTTPTRLRRHLDKTAIPPFAFY